jgi:peptide/nickel transport system permease protein
MMAMSSMETASRSRSFSFPTGLTLPVVIGAAITLFWVVTALSVDLWPLYDPLDMVARRLMPPSAAHWFGTDALGRDVLTRTLHGARSSLLMSCAVIFFAVSIGSTLGAIAGYVGGFVDNAIMRLVDVTLSFPPILLAMAVTAALGPGLENAAIAMIIVWWPVYARLMRGQVLTVSEGAIHFYQWWICAGPGLAILSVVLGFNFLGDGLSDYLDPRRK